jgi:hypothetical protein
MQRFLKWLGTLVFGGPQTRPARPDLRVTNSHLRTAQARRRTAALAEARPRDSGSYRAEDFDADSELGSRIEDGGPGKNVLRPRYVREESGTHETLKILDADLAESSDDGGFDPYNTGRFDRYANWSRRTRQ